MTNLTKRNVARKVKSFRQNRLLKDGAFTINLWSTMPNIKFGAASDDWKAVGLDVRKAMAAYSDEHG